MAPPSSSQASSKAYAPLWLKVLVIVMGLLIVVGFIVVAAEIARRMSNASGVSSPAASKAAFAQRIALPSGAKVISLHTTDDRLIVHVEMQGGTVAAYVVDPRSGSLLGTIEFPPGAGR